MQLCSMCVVSSKGQNHRFISWFSKFVCNFRGYAVYKVKDLLGRILHARLDWYFRNAVKMRTLKNSILVPFSVDQSIHNAIHYVQMPPSL